MLKAKDWFSALADNIIGIILRFSVCLSEGQLSGWPRYYAGYLRRGRMIVINPHYYGVIIMAVTIKHGFVAFNYHGFQGIVVAVSKYKTGI